MKTFEDIFAGVDKLIFISYNCVGWIQKEHSSKGNIEHIKNTEHITT